MSVSTTAQQEGPRLHPNEQTIRRAMAALTRADLDAFAHFLADDFVIHIPGGGRLAGDHGKEGFLGMVVPVLIEASAGTLQVDVHDVLATDDHAVGLYRFSAARDLRRYEWRHVNVYHPRNGQIAEVFFNPFDRQVFEELVH
jgi:ketosteroid isomerase-like protein